jgi:hypothetical protein
MHQNHAILPTQQTSAGRKEDNSDGREGNSDGTEEKTTAMTTRVQNIHPSIPRRMNCLKPFSKFLLFKPK